MPRKTEKRSVSRRNNGRSGRSGTVRRSNSRTLSRKKRTYSNISNRVSQTRKTVGSYKAMINKKVYGDCKTKMIKINGFLTRVPQHMVKPLGKINIRNGLPPMRELGSTFENLREDYVKTGNPKNLLQMILILFVIQNRWEKYTKDLGFPKVHEDIQKIDIDKPDFNLENEIESITPEQVKEISSEEIKDIKSEEINSL